MGMRDHAADIRALRKQSNAAIAALDPNYVVAFMAEDVTVAVAGGAVLRGRAANRDAFAAQMAEPGFGGYLRTPEQVLVAQDPLRATEIGTWTGRWRLKGHVHQQQGRYRAEWAFTDAGWLITHEAYQDGIG
jgi:ketosteroid isomerase-like protein